MSALTYEHQAMAMALAVEIELGPQDWPTRSAYTRMVDAVARQLAGGNGDARGAFLRQVDDNRRFIREVRGSAPLPRGWQVTPSHLRHAEVIA